jgi:hypothetical protein
MTEKKVASDKKTRFLSFEQKWRLSELMRNRAEKIMTERPLFTELAAEVSKELGFDVAPGTVKEVAKIVGLTWEPRLKMGASGSKRAHAKIMEVEQKLTEGITVLRGQIKEANERTATVNQWAQSRITELQAQVDTLRGLVHHLYHVLQEKPPQGYTLPPHPLSDNLHRITDRK